VSEQDSSFELSKNIEHYLAALSKLYAHEGEQQKLEIIVNSQVRVTEEWSSDNWDVISDNSRRGSFGFCRMTGTD
jgi:hypothetical protein